MSAMLLAGPVAEPLSLAEAKAFLRIGHDDDDTLIGALIVAVIRTAMVYLEVPATAQQIVFGIVLIAAIALPIDRSKLAMVK